MPEPEALKDLSPVLASLSQWLKDQQVPYAIIGGVAIGFVAQPRITQDVDAVIWIDLDRAEDFLESGIGYGFVPRVSDPIEFARKLASSCFVIGKIMASICHVAPYLSSEKCWTAQQS